MKLFYMRLNQSMIKIIVQSNADVGYWPAAALKGGLFNPPQAQLGHMGAGVVFNMKNTIKDERTFESVRINNERDEGKHTQDENRGIIFFEGEGAH